MKGSKDTTNRNCLWADRRPCPFILVLMVVSPLVFWAQGSLKERQTEFIPFRPDILELSYQSLSNTRNGLTLDDPVTEEDLEDNHRLLSARLRFPVVIGKKLMVAGEVSYKEEQFYPWATDQEEVFSEPLDLLNTGLGFIFQYTLSETQFLKGYMKHSLKGDRLSFDDWPQNTATNVSLVWGKSIDKDRKVGAGVFLNHSLGRTRPWPVLVYEKQISPRAKIETLFPKELNFKYVVNKRLQFSANYDIESARYLLAQNELLRGAEDIEFRRTSFFLKTGLDFCLTDIFAVFVDVGLEYPANTIIVERGGRSRDALWDFQPQITPVINFGLVALAPSKLFSRISD